MKRFVSLVFCLVAFLFASSVTRAEIEDSSGARLTAVCKSKDAATKYAVMRKTVAETMNVAKFTEELVKLLQSGECAQIENRAHGGGNVLARYPTRFNALIITEQNGEFIVMEEIAVATGESFDLCTTEDAAESVAKLYASYDDGELVDKSAIPEFASKKCRNVTPKADIKIVRRSEFSDSDIEDPALYEVGELLVDGVAHYAVIGTRF